MKKITILFLFFLTIQLNTYSQNAVFDWAKRMGGTGTDIANATTVDASGNVYTIGYFGGTANFNPAGSFLLSSYGSDDVFVSKLDSLGNFIWAFKLGGTLSDVGHDIAVDASGNVYVAGSFSGTANFNPAGTANLTSAGSNDVFIAKYTSAGAYVWAKRMGSTLPDIAYAMTIDGAANVYTTGYFFGTVNFNPGGTFNLTSAGSADIFISKLDASGTFVWAKKLGGILDDISSGIAVDASSNVYTTGKFQDVADFDPNGTTYNLTCNGIDNIFISKLNVSGNFVWAKRMGTKNVDGGGIAVDASSNVYVAGRFDSVADFGAINLTSAGNIDAFVTKLDATGSFVWANNMGGTLSDAANAISLDAAGNVYTTGHFNGVADFNPGAGIQNMTSAGSGDCFISKLTNTGAFVWAKQSGGTGFDTGLSIKIKSAGSAIHIAGGFVNTSNFNPPGTFNLTSAGGNDIYVHRLKLCTNTFKTINVASCLSYTLNSQTYTTSGTYTQNLVNAAGCDSTLTINLRISNVVSSISSQTNVSCFGGNNGSATVLPAGGILPYTYSWSPSGGTGITGTSLSAGSYACLITDSIGCVHTQPVTITQPLSPLSLSTSFTNASCTNDGTATVVATGGTPGYTYLWSNTAITPGITGLVAGTYSVVVTDTKGCTNTSSVTITNSILPLTPEICMVTVDDSSINNVIYWDKTMYTNADSFIVYREVSTSTYIRIAAISNDSLSEFVDTSRSVGPANGDPNAGSYRYKLQVRDICGNYSLLSPYHNTIYIIDAGLGQFTWSIPYTIEGAANPVSNYVLLCDTANVDIWTSVATVAGTQVTAVDPGFSFHPTNANWRVKTLWSIACTPTRASINTTRSNIKRGMLTTGINSNFKNGITVYPNPATESVTIELAEFIQSGMIKIINVLGETVYQENIHSSGTGKISEKINIQGYSKGIYTVCIENNGTKVFKKLVIN